MHCKNEDAVTALIHVLEIMYNYSLSDHDLSVCLLPMPSGACISVMTGYFVLMQWENLV
jgi:hypothetical protein